MTLHIMPATVSAPSGSMLASKAVLAKLSISTWSARKFDAKATSEVAANHGGRGDVGRFNKKLLAGDELAAIAAVARAAREDHYAMTLPWLDDGARILPAGLDMAYADKMRGHRHDFEAAVSRLMPAYPAMVADARLRLNGLFDVKDYPSESDLAKRFAFQVLRLPVPDASDFRVTVGDGAREDLERAIRETMTAALADAAGRVRETVGRMAEKLREFKPATGPGDRAEGIFRDSLVSNVRDLAAVLPAFNLTDDPTLAAVAARMSADLCAFDPETLRSDPVARKMTADAAAEIVESVSAFFA